MAAALALAVTLPVVSAQAQSIRTFVSTAGSDNPSCSITSPCRHFSAAVAATAAGGEVDALDPGAYGSFSISHAITIEGQGWSYVAPPSGGAAITITAGASDKINIHGGLLVLQDSALRLLTTGLSIANTHADVIDTSIVGNTTGIQTNGAGAQHNSVVGGCIGSGPTLVRINAGNIINNTTAFNENNPTASSDGSGVSTCTIYLFTPGTSPATNITGSTNLMTITGTGGTSPGFQTYNANAAP
jgi:hypothetical protein